MPAAFTFRHFAAGGGGADAGAGAGAGDAGTAAAAGGAVACVEAAGIRSRHPAGGITGLSAVYNAQAQVKIKLRRNMHIP